MKITVKFILLFYLLMLISPIMSQEVKMSLDFSTYAGGSGWEHARDVFVDDSGNVYVVGGTTSVDFPTTPGAFDTSFNSGGTDSPEMCDGFVMKFDKDGKLIWSTYFGGPNYDRIYGVEVDLNGYVYICGRGGKGLPTTANAFQQDFKGKNWGGYGGWQNTFVAKLKPDGSDVVWASYAGVGALGRDLAVDTNGDIILNVGFPVTIDTLPAEWFENAFQKTPQGDDDCGVMKIKSDGTQVLWATYLGGTGKESDAASVRVDDSGFVYIGCSTYSVDMPVTEGAFDTTHNGTVDFYVAKLSPDGSRLIFGTYLGGSANEWISTHNLAIDKEGNVYAAPWTGSANYPVTTGVFQTVMKGGNSEMAVTKLSPTGALLASTFVGGSLNENPDGIYVDSTGNVFISGETGSTDFPVTEDAYQKTNNGQNDAVVSLLSADFSRMIYSTYIGGTAYDNGRSGFLDKHGNFYVVGSTDGEDYPLKNPFQDTYHGGETGSFGIGDVIISKFCKQESTIVEEQIIIDNLFTISPNPASDYIEIMTGSRRQTADGGQEIRIYNMLGECVLKPFLSSPFGEGQGVRLDVSGLANGIYQILINFDDMLVTNQFVVLR